MCTSIYLVFPMTGPSIRTCVSKPNGSATHATCLPVMALGNICTLLCEPCWAESHAKMCEYMNGIILHVIVYVLNRQHTCILRTQYQVVSNLWWAMCLCATIDWSLSDRWYSRLHFVIHMLTVRGFPNGHVGPVQDGSPKPYKALQELLDVTSDWTRLTRHETKIMAGRLIILSVVAVGSRC